MNQVELQQLAELLDKARKLLPEATNVWVEKSVSDGLFLVGETTYVSNGERQDFVLVGNEIISSTNLIY